MTQVSLVVAVDEAGGIGFNNQLLCHLPRDLQHFKALTVGKAVIMGRKTFQSIGKPLSMRVNLVLTRQAGTAEGAERLTNAELSAEAGVLRLPSLEEALRLCQDLTEVMIIGGAQIYQQALPIADCVYMTRIHHRFQADVFFPLLAEHEWHCAECVQHAADEKNAYPFSFCRYVRLLASPQP